ncbi:unnamed protein product, partial [Cuscuta campestris]
PQLVSTVAPVNLTGALNAAGPSRPPQGTNPQITPDGHCVSVESSDDEWDIPRTHKKKKGKTIRPATSRNSAFERLGDREEGEGREAEPARTQRSRSNRQEAVRTRASRQEEEAESQPHGPVVNRLTMPRKVKIDAPRFTRKEALEIHLDSFNQSATMNGCIDKEKCLLFFQTLRNQATEWFNKLRPGSIDSFTDLASKFKAKFQENCTKRKKFTYLSTAGQRESENLTQGKEYLQKIQERNHQWIMRAAPGNDRDDNRRRNNRQREQQPAPDKEHIGMIFGGPEGGDSAAQRKNWVRSIHVGEVSADPVRRKQTRREPIVFTDRDLLAIDEDHNDPLVITMDINGLDIARVLIDTGSSVNILYMETFQKLRLCRTQLEPLKTPLSGFTGDTVEAEGSIVIPIELGSGDKTVWKKMRFIVVDIKCVHNTILGMPCINKVRAIISMPHLCMKLHTPGGVGEVRGDQRNARECYARAVKKMTKGVYVISQEITKGETREKLKPEAEMVEIELHPGDPSRMTLADFLVEMTGLTPDLPGSQPTKQWWEMAVDGASGPKGYGGGMVFTTPEGFKIYHALVFNFKLTNNEAEYEALARGLRLAQALKIDRVSIKFDSSLIVGQVTGNMEAREGRMAQYKDLVLALLKGIAEFKIAQIPRAKNTDAYLFSKLTQSAPEHVSKLARVEILDHASIEKLKVATIEGQPDRSNSTTVGADNHRMDDLMKYLADGSFATTQKPA